MTSRVTIVLLLLLAVSPGHSQQPALDANQPLAVPPVSPEVHADHRITFRIVAPTAPAMQLHIEGADHAMTRADNGVWSVTVGPFTPETYEYSFETGGARMSGALVDVPGTPMPDDQLQDVPHGTVTLHTYASAIQRRPRNLRVYLPPQYYTHPSQRFPVLYLFAGSDETGWTTTGRANVVLDNLIAQGKAVPMIIVMPNNNINGGDGRDAVFPAALDNMKVIDAELQAEILPMIEKLYRVRADRNHRAIAGLSFGGGTAFGVGMRHLDRFAFVGEFGTGLFGGADAPPPGHTNYVAFDPETIAPGMVRSLLNPSTRPKVLYMSVGERDPRAPHQKKAYDDFRKAGVDVTFRTFPGGHEFKVFRPSLAEFATLIFR